MKGLYICVGQNLDDKSSGITNKILNQIEVMKKNNFEVDIINISNSTNFIDKIKFFLPGILSDYQKRQINCIDKYDINKYQFVYIRKPVLSKAFIILLKRIKEQNHNIKVIMEIPTYPIYGEYKGVRKLLVINSIITSKKISRYVDRIVTYSNDNIIWGVKTIRISNCVNFSKIVPKKDNVNEDEINVIAVALFSHWHGYDRFIKGMYEYYKKGGKRKINLHLVGDSEVLNEYREKVSCYKLNDNVIFYGKKYGEELDKIYDTCDLALDALGRHRSGVYYNSSLKGKEYCAKGLPIISGVKTELDYNKEYSYYLRVDADESDIDMLDIIEFYDKIYNSNKTRKDIINFIRSYSEEYFDFKNGFNPIINYINNVQSVTEENK